MRLWQSDRGLKTLPWSYGWQKKLFCSCLCDCDDRFFFFSLAEDVVYTLCLKCRPERDSRHLQHSTCIWRCRRLLEEGSWENGETMLRAWPVSSDVICVADSGVTQITAPCQGVFQETPIRDPHPGSWELSLIRYWTTGRGWKVILLIIQWAAGKKGDDSTLKAPDCVVY